MPSAIRNRWMTSTSRTATDDASLLDQDRLAWLTLALVPGIGASRMAALCSTFGSPAAVLAAPPDALAAVRGIGRAAASAITSARPAAVERLITRAERGGLQLLIPSDASFPARLREIPDPPTLLWLRGSSALLSREAVAIVGSRDHTRYGADVARMLAEGAATAGIVVVSGMARGLDAEAHRGALDVGGGTIGVLGHGVDQVYPTVNRELFREVAERGLLLSEHPPGERARAGAFPRRNRLISGLARALVVVEAAEGSGTMITVTAALEQGREVFVVPGPITSPTSAGANRLLRDGATPLLTLDDLLRAYGATPAAAAPSPPSVPCTLSPTEARVWDALTDAPRHVDDLALAAGLPVGELLVTLLGLELGGLAEQGAGGRYRRVGFRPAGRSSIADR